jgi:hypothetical protein
MKGLHEFDRGLRKIFSTIYRLIIIAFATFVIYTSTNEFPDLYYVLSSILYFTSFFFILNKDRYSKLRLLSDYLYIFLIIFGRDSTNVAALLIILLPVINSPNHSGRASSPFLVVLLTFSLFIYLIRNSTIFNSGTGYTAFYIITPFFLFFIIVLFQEFRTKLIRLNDRFNAAIDNYYENSIQFAEKPHKILRTITDLINSSKIISFKTKRLLCFKIVGEKMSIIGGTQFVFHYDIKDRQRFLLNLENNNIIKNWKITLDQLDCRYNFSFLTKTANASYVFLFVTSSDPSIFFCTMIKSVFFRMVKILSFENSLLSQKNKYLEKLKNKMEFIEDAQVAMHFIKNKLSPVVNFISISEDLDGIDTQKWDEAIAHFKKERLKIKTNIPLILEKAQRFHGNVDKPFSSADYKQEKAKKLFAIVRNNWNSYFSDDDIETNLNVEKVDLYRIEINEDLLEFLLTNWISNMQKYGHNVKRLIFQENLQDVIVTFENDFRENSRVEAERFVKDFNSDERNEIINRGGHTRGLRELKFFVRELNIPNTMSIERNLINFSLSFKKIT